jgi:hypothetical protein
MITIEFLKKHADTIAIIFVVIGAWHKLDVKINDIDKRLTVIESSSIVQKLEDIDKRLTVIETVMLCNKMMPSHVAATEVK